MKAKKDLKTSRQCDLRSGISHPNAINGRFSLAGASSLIQISIVTGLMDLEPEVFL